MQRNDKDHAIVIGINTYSQLRRLQAAHKDAEEFATWLESPEGGGLPKENVHRVYSLEKPPSDPYDAVPIQRDIDRALRDIGIEQKKRVGRRLYFYFSGHGVGPVFDEVAMLMADAAMDRLDSNIGMRPYRDLFRKTGRFEEIVFILDCCRDPAKDVWPSPPKYKPRDDSELPIPAVQDFVVLASAYGEKAFEPTDRETGERRGLLTKAVLEGLRKPEAADVRGCITACTLRNYVMKRVPELATKEELSQVPEIQLPTSDMIFTQVPVISVRVQIVAPKGLRGKLVLRDAEGREIDEHAAFFGKSQPPWEISLPRNSRYEIEHIESGLTVIMDLIKAKDELYVYQFPRPR